MSRAGSGRSTSCGRRPRRAPPTPRSSSRCRPAGVIRPSPPAILPCFWIYDDVGTRLKESVGDLGGHPYGDWIATYGDPAFAESTRQACAIVDRLADEADPATRKRMTAAFTRAAQYEWMFWDAADRMEDWPIR